jgi:hypothetical protein
MVRLAGLCLPTSDSACCHSGGAFSLDACAQTTGSAAGNYRVAAAADFVVFGINAGHSQYRAWRVSTQGELTEEKDLGPADGDGFFTASGSLGGFTTIITSRHEDWLCTTSKLRSWSPDLTTVAEVDLLPQEFIPLRQPAMAVDGSRVFVALAGECSLGGFAPCSGPAGSDPSVAFLAIEDDAGFDRRVVPLPRETTYLAMVDGGLFVVAYIASDGIRIRRFSSDGQLVDQSAPLPLEYVATGGTLNNLDAVLRLGAGDYALAYSYTDLFGTKSSLVRLLMTPR